MKKCSFCNNLYDDKLILCPNCHHAVNKENKIFTEKEFLEIEKKIEKKFFKTIFFWASIFSLIFGVSLLKVYFSVSEKIEAIMMERITAEFKTERIKNTVQDIAGTNAKKIIENEISPLVETFKKNINKKNEKLTYDLENLTQLTELDIASKYDSKTAYLSLQKLENKNAFFKKIIPQRVDAIKRDLLIYSEAPSFFQSLSVEKGNGEKIQADSVLTKDLFIFLENKEVNKTHIPALMAYIIRKPKNEIIQNALRVFSNSDSLIANAATCGILSEVYKVKIDFMDIEKWKEFCESELMNEK